MGMGVDTFFLQFSLNYNTQTSTQMIKKTESYKKLSMSSEIVSTKIVYMFEKKTFWFYFIVTDIK